MGSHWYHNIVLQRLLSNSPIRLVSALVEPAYTGTPVIYVL
jgi:hypothetical protein